MNLAILQARMSSTRLPGKVLLDIMGEPMLYRQIERIQQSSLIDRLIVATSTNSEDDIIEQLCEKKGIECYRGSLGNVLSRFYEISNKYKPQNIIRLTGDCPLIDFYIIDEVIDLHIKEDNDYTSNCVECTFPDGLDVEVISRHALNIMFSKAHLASQKEHVTLYIHDNHSDFKIGNLRSDIDRSNLRWTVDELEDYNFVKEIYMALYTNNKYFQYEDILKLLTVRPELIDINSNFKRNEGLEKILLKEQKENRRK